MARFDGKVAFVTGAARGPGRAIAVRLASEGADIIAIDICDAVPTNVATAATPEDLEETARLVEKHGRRVYAAQADVRSYDGLSSALEAGIAQLGRLDIVCANAGVWSFGLMHELSEQQWREVIDVCLTGVWHTCKAAVPHLIEQGEGGSIIITSSAAGLVGFPNGSHYVAAKHGLIGLMRSMANELGQHWVRVNTVNPGTVNSPLIHNDATTGLLAPDLAEPSAEAVMERFQERNLLPVPWLEPDDIASMVAFLCSDEARSITGSVFSVDLGTVVRN